MEGHAKASSFKLVGATAIKMLARLAARNAVKAQLRGQGVRVSHVPHAEIVARATEYLAAHPELYEQALQRAQHLGMIDHDPMTMER